MSDSFEKANEYMRRASEDLRMASDMVQRLERASSDKVQRLERESAEMIQTKQKKCDAEIEEKKQLFEREMAEKRELLKAEQDELNAKVKHFKLLQERMDEAIKNAQEKVKLNVGGQIFSVSKSTLLNTTSNSYFTALLGSDRWKPDSDGEYYIDRDPLHFGRILTFLRTGNLNVDGLSKVGRDLLAVELDYYQIQALIKFAIKGAVAIAGQAKTLEVSENSFKVALPCDTHCHVFDTPFPTTGVFTLKIYLAKSSGCHGWISLWSSLSLPSQGAILPALSMYLGGSGGQIYSGSHNLTSYDKNPSMSYEMIGGGPGGRTGESHEFEMDMDNWSLGWKVNAAYKGCTSLPGAKSSSLWLGFGMWCCSEYEIHFSW